VQIHYQNNFPFSFPFSKLDQFVLATKLTKKLKRINSIKLFFGEFLHKALIFNFDL
jgi:hypothetical protein